MKRFASRKFLLTLGAALVAIGTALTGEQTWGAAIWQAITAVLAYVGVEGILDLRALKP